MSEDADSAVEESAELFEWTRNLGESYASDNHPLVVYPRGGTREVGRSCYELQTRTGRYLIDCGLKQSNQPDQRGGSEFSQSVEYPIIRDLEPHSIDGILITHAHIDHTGALPLLEAENLLHRTAPILCTRPTANLMHELLLDSVEIHESRRERMSREKRFTRDDVHDVLERVEPLSYGQYDLSRYVHHEDEDLTVRFGNAAHLLGSAWISAEADGRRVVFSGDVGGRSAHLPDVEEPPSADTLFIESTYGDKDHHSSIDNARTEIYETIIDAVRQDIPVLIPTFAVGRSQELLQIIRERWRHLDDDLQEKLDVVYDGMVVDATNIYNAFGVDAWVNDKINNYRANAADHRPFEPDCVSSPTNNEDRAEVFDGDRTPVVVSSSGMLTGGPSPAYLVDLARNYDEARIIITGYQARGTPGRYLVDNGADIVDLELRAKPHATDSDPVSTDGERPIQRVEVPRDWVKSIGGLSGHIARNRLLEFARDVNPDHVSLVHGPSDAQLEMQSYLDQNLVGSDVTRSKIRRPIPIRVGGAVDIEPEIEDIAIAAESSSEDDRTGSETVPEPVQQRLNHLEERQGAIARELAAERNDEGYTEAEIREMIRQEIQTVLSDALSQYEGH